MTQTARRMKIILITLAGVLLLDQITKMLVESLMSPQQSIPLISPFLHLVHVRNTGAAFGLLANAPEGFRSVFFIGITLSAVVLLAILIRRFKDDGILLPLSLCLILAGAAGNLIDRLRLGEVIDFIDLRYGQFHWPAFNVADFSITVGVGLLILHTAFFDGKRRR